MIELEPQAQPELLPVDLEFDFLAWESELAEIDLEEVALDAFNGILTFESTDEQPRTIEDIQQEVRMFLSNPEIVALESIMSEAAVRFAAFCQHNHVDASGLDGDLQGMKQYGDNVLKDASEKNHDHDHEDDYEIDPKTGKKKKKKRRS